MKTDVYQKVTDTIVAQLENGVRPWFQPWNAEARLSWERTGRVLPRRRARASPAHRQARAERFS
jgi:antirestriction protein ArdC